jgi:hypothetical protein
MTNAIEQTKREMWESIANAKGRISINYSVKDMMRGVEEFEGLLEDHLEELRKDRAAVAEERDTMRNQLQALQMASSTAAEVIRGLRRELEEAREGVSAADAKAEAGSASSERMDAYTMGLNDAGKCSNPFPTNTIERLHWNDGANDALRCGVIVDTAQMERNRKAALTQVEGFRSGQVCGSNGSAFP